MNYLYTKTCLASILMGMLCIFQFSSKAQNNCLDFDGVDDYVSTTAINPASFTYEAWINPDNTTNDQAIISSLNEIGLKGSELHISSNAVSLTMRNNTEWHNIITSAGVINTGNWFHLATTYDGTTAIIYINGEQAVSETEATYIAGSTPLTIGRRSSGLLNFDGKIDDICVWNRALTQTEVQARMNTSIAGIESGLLLNYNLNQGIADGNNTGITSATDATTNGNDGTLSGFALTGTTSNWTKGAPKPEPTNHATIFTASLNGSNIELAWSDEASAEGYLILASTTNSFTDPIDGVESSVDKDLSDGSVVIKVPQGTETYSGFTNAATGNTYYFRIYPYNNSGLDINYKTNGTVPESSVFLPKTEPSNHATAFTANVNSGNIELSWIDEPTADAYLILASTTNTFTVPTDGNIPVADNDLADGSGTIFALQGDEIYSTWLNTSFGTTYYFQIYAYTITGSYPNYNTNPTIPTVDIIIPYQLFSYHSTSISDYNQGAIAWGDFNNDGALDIIATGKTGGNVTSLYKNNEDKTFSWQTSYSGVQGSIVWCDYDNDNDLDFVMAGSGVTSIFRNESGSFVKQSDISFMGVTSGSVDWGDFDNDGFMDLIVTGLDNISVEITKIYHNNGNNTFQELNIDNIIGIQHGVVSCGDYNNDKFCDFIIVGGYFDNYDMGKLYKSNGDGTFTEQSDIEIPPLNMASADWGDYDNDGDLDLLLSGIHKTSNNEVNTVYQNNGNNTFTEQTGITLDDPTDYRHSIAWADYDNDGYLDIFQLVGDYTQIYHNDKDGSFTKKSLTEYSIAPGNMAFGDFDKDGDLDLLVTDKSSNDYATTLYNNNCATINTAPTVPNGLTITQTKDNAILSWNKSTDNTTPSEGLTYNIRIGTTAGGCDLLSPQALTDGTLLIPANGNNSTDTSYGFSCDPETYYWAVQTIDKSYAASSFSSEQTFIRTSFPATNLSAQINSSSSLMLRWETGSLSRRAVFCKQAYSGSATPVDGDYYLADPYYGKGDEIGATGWYCVYNGKADSTMVYGLDADYGYIFHVLEYTSQSETTDYVLDVADGNPAVFGVTEFLSQPSSISGITTNLSGGTSSWVDYNNNGYLDLFLTGSSSSSYLYANNGDGSFTENSIFNSNYHITEIAWGDYNNDGFQDAIASCDSNVYTSVYKIDSTYDSSANSWIYDSTYTGYTTQTNYFSVIYKNNNGEEFIKQSITNIPPAYDGSIKWGDYNNDGLLDLILTGRSTSIVNTSSISYTKLFKNNGENSFSEVSEEFPGGGNGDVEWGDIDNDGDLDIVLAGNNVSKIYINNNGTFDEQTTLQLTQIDSQATIRLADFNNDGLIDIILFGYTDSRHISEIYRNTGDGQFNKESTCAITTITSGSVNIGDYNNDGLIDVLAIGYATWYGWLSGEAPFAKLYLNISNSNDNLIEFEEVKQNGLIGSSNGASNYGDYDNDGDLDVIITGQNDLIAYTKFYTNNTIMNAGSFAPNKTPTVPQNLTKEPLRGGVLLSWNAITSDETPSSTMSYNIRVGTSKDSMNLYAPNFVDSVNFKNRTVTQMGNAGLNTFYKIYNLPDLADDKYYYWQVQAVDGGFLGGEWSRVDSFQIQSAQAYFSYNIACKSDTTFFKDESVAYDGITAWKWNFGDNSGLNYEQNPSHVFQSAGEHSVQLVVTNSQGKTDTITQIVYVKPTPSVSFTATDGCGAFSTELDNLTSTTGLINSWFWNFGDGQTSIYGDPLSHVYGATGNFTITLSASDTNGCSSTISHDIVVTTKPNTSLTLEYGTLINGSPSFCLGDSVMYSVAANANYSYQWQRDNSNIANTTNQLKVKTVTGNYKVIISNNLATTCADTSEVKTITVKQVPAPPVLEAESAVSFCQGDSVKITLGSYSGVTFNWFKNGGSLDGSQNYFMAKESGNYTSRVTLSNNCYSSSEIPVVVNVKPNPPTPSLNYGDSTICSGITLNYSTVNNPALTYQWYSNNDPIPGATNNLFPIAQSGNYKLEATLNNCSVTTSPVAVTVNPVPTTPVIDAPASTNFCEGSSVTLQTNYIDGLTYQWLNNNASIGENSNQLFATIGGNYSVEVINNYLCKAASNTISLTRTSAPTAPSLNYGDSTICSGITLNYSTVNNPALTYQWYSNNDPIPGATNNLFPIAQSGNYKLEATLNNCSVTTSPVVVTVNLSPVQPEIIISGADIVCSGESLVLSTEYFNDESYQWYRGSTALSGQTSDSLFVSQLGEYEYKVLSRLGNCVLTSTPVTAKVNELPSVINLTLSGDSIFCSGSSLTLTANGNPANYYYQWFRGYGISIDGATSNELIVNESYQYKVRVQNPQTYCERESRSIQVTVKNSPNTPEITVDNNKTDFCQGESTLLRTSATNVNWIWGKVGDSNSLSDNNNLTVTNSGDYFVKVINSENCEATSLTQTITVFDSPVKNYLYYEGETQFCEGGSVLIKTNYNTNINTDYILQWKTLEGSIDGANLKNYLASQSGYYWLEVINANQCSVVTDTLQVLVDAMPPTPFIMEQNNTTEFCPGTQLELLVDNASSNYEYQWQRFSNNIPNATQSVYGGKLTGGDYSVELTYGTCMLTSNILTLTEKLAPEKPLISGQGPVEWMLFCSETNATAYRWYFDNVLIVGAKYSMYFANRNLGNYYVEINMGEECWTRSDILNIPSGDLIDGIPTLNSKAISIYPNPSQGEFTVHLGTQLPGNLKVQLTDVLGKNMANYEYSFVREFSVSLHEFPQGIYFCKMEYKGNIVMKKIIKN
ncbi:MAG: VCBS repeat-containing protein [Salinivirgaceae bacterium]|nr:VCBS repeat-containing protein [Salinivirgaceae bacterium]